MQEAEPTAVAEGQFQQILVQGDATLDLTCRAVVDLDQCATNSSDWTSGNDYKRQSRL